jgi:formimidoylglutamate deiminase
VTPAAPNSAPAAQLASPPAWITSATKTGMSASRTTVSAFGSCASGAGTALVAISKNGSLAPVPGRLTLQGFVNAHSHAFQRALRGRAEGDDFWGWRDAMLAEAEALTSERIRESYEATYREMRAAGYTAVGEFHYIGFDEARTAADAAEAAGIELVLLHVAYARGGIDRFRQESVEDYMRQVDALAAGGIRVGVAPHSVRACPLDWLEEIGRYAERNGLVVHVHADEQPREIEECLAEHGLRPIELLERAGCLGARTTIVHATHADDHELDLLAESGARVCLCPTTEANLGDGFIPVERLRARGIPLCIGSDSNVRIDPLEELRELEGTARRQALRRNVVSPEELLLIGTSAGAAALGLDEWPGVVVDLEHRALAGVADGEVEAALVFGCAADVFASP